MRKALIFVDFPLYFSGAAFASGRGMVRIEFPTMEWFAMMINWVIGDFWDVVLVEIPRCSYSKKNFKF